MASRRQLVSRSRLNENSSPAQRHQRDEIVEETALPPYEPPSFPLTKKQRNALDSLRINYDHTKYKKHLELSKKTITLAAGEINDRLPIRQEKVKRIKEKIRAQNREPTADEAEIIQYAKTFEKHVTDITAKAEQAMRELIDYSNELAMHDSILKGVADEIAAAPAPQARQRRRPRPREDDESGEDTAEEEIEHAAPDVPVVSALEIMKKAREDLQASWTSKSMRDRYTGNDYSNFKRTVHDAIHGENGPPVPHASTWFRDDPRHPRRVASSTDNTGNGSDDSDDDVVIESATTNLKCPLTLLMFVEPWSNKKCPHTYEKAAFLGYFETEARAFQPSQRRGPVPSVRQVKCPETGCEAMLQLDDFYDDEALRRQVKRAQKKLAAREMDDDDEDEEILEPGGQGGAEESEDDKPTPRKIRKVKREQRSRGPGMAPIYPELEDEDEPIKTPEKSD